MHLQQTTYVSLHCGKTRNSLSVEQFLLLRQYFQLYLMLCNLFIEMSPIFSSIFEVVCCRFVVCGKGYIYSNILHWIFYSSIFYKFCLIFSGILMHLQQTAFVNTFPHIYAFWCFCSRWLFVNIVINLQQTTLKTSH